MHQSGEDYLKTILLLHKLGHYVASMHIEGEEENNVILNDIANEISYKLYLKMDCDTTIQIDYLDTDSVMYDLIYKKAEQEIQRFEASGMISQENCKRNKIKSGRP